MLDQRVPAFFVQDADALGRGAIEPDILRHRDLPELRSSEAPEHFLDLELLAGEALPPTRHEFLALCAARQLDPRKVGMVPYAIVEWTQRLTLAFAEHRRRPDDPHIRARCLVYAGFVAHYAQDLCQPLHATIHFDGRAQNGVSPRTGIHRRVDDLLGKTPLVEAEVLADVEPVVFEALMPAVIEELYRSNALVDRVYEMKDDFPPTDGTWRPTPAVLDFARDRLRASAGLTASLYLTAWENSARITLPDWLDRTAPMEASEP